MNFADRRTSSKVVKLADDTDPPPRPDLVIYTERTPWTLRRS